MSDEARAPRYKKVLLKLSGEALAGERGVGLDYSVIDRMAAEIRAVHARRVQLDLVVGGGNIVRGTTASAEGHDRVSADFMGMLATVINALALQNVLERQGLETRVMTAIRSGQTPASRTTSMPGCGISPCVLAWALSSSSPM